MYLTVVCEEFFHDYRFTITRIPDSNLNDCTWIVGDEALDFLIRTLNLIELPELFNFVQTKKKKVLLSGSFCKESIKQLFKSAKFLDLNPIFFIPENESAFDKPYWRKVYSTLLTEADMVFMFIGEKESMPTSFGTVERMAESLGIPVYRKEAIDKMIIKKAMGEDQNDSQFDDSSNDSNNSFDGSGTLCIN